MSFRAFVWAWDQPLAKDEHLVVLLALADISNDAGLIRASQLYIAKKARKTERTIRRALEAMITGGVIRVEERPGRVDHIHLLIPDEFTVRMGKDQELEVGKRGRPRKPLPTARDNSGHEGGKEAPKVSAEPKEEPKGRTGVEADASAGAGADDVRRAFEIYNRLADKIGTPRAERLNDDRKRRLKARLKDAGGLEGWHAALSRVENSAFLTGQTHHHFRLTLDFLIQPSSFTKLIEGQYEDRPDGRGSPASSLGPDRGRDQHDQRVGAMLTGAVEAVNRRRRWGLGH